MELYPPERVDAPGFSKAADQGLTRVLHKLITRGLTVCAGIYKSIGRETVEPLRVCETGLCGYHNQYRSGTPVSEKRLHWRRFG